MGEATYGHREPFQAHDAVQDAEGNKAGSFSYVAPDGRVLTTEYVADAGGYRVASNALPIAGGPSSAPASAATFIAAEKPSEFATDDSIVVEAKSRSRRSVAFDAPAPILKAEPAFATKAFYYQSPTAYAYQPYSYSYTSSPYAYSAYSAPIYRSYSYPTYPYPSNFYYRNFGFRK